ncbi:MAG: radical SAM protein [Pseudomonadota bacterium]|nr:radical SAM protein [Pseudomonadota bacterium]
MPAPRRGKTASSYLMAGERGAVIKEWGGRYPVALGYPNVYQVGMGNLGFLSMYAILNAHPQIVAERFFLSESGRENLPVLTLESGRPLSAARLILFSISFERDYLHVLEILKSLGLALLADDRQPTDPLVMAGGVATFINPLPLSSFVDAFLLGEGERQVPQVMELLLAGQQMKKSELLLSLFGVPGVYLPNSAREKSVEDYAPVKIPHYSDLDRFIPTSVVTTADSASPLSASYLVEINRGCPRGCRFCAAGFVYRPFRNRSLSCLQSIFAGAMENGYRHFGLIGSALGDYPHLKELCSWLVQKGATFSPASLRVDCLDAELLELLLAGGVKTLTVAPEAGSSRLRKLIHKQLNEDQILVASRLAVMTGIYQLKLYFLMGLPSETVEDLDDIFHLVSKIRKIMLDHRQSKQKSIQLTISINPFIPKPHTPMQWAPFAGLKSLQEKQHYIQKLLRPLGNVKLEMENPWDAAWQTMLSRGNRDMGRLLLAMVERSQSPRRLIREAIKNSASLFAAQPLDMPLPWSFMHHHTSAATLLKMYQQLEN